VMATMQRYLSFPASLIMLEVILDPHGSLSNCHPQFEREVRSLQLISSHYLAPRGYFTVQDVINYLGTNGLALLYCKQYSSEYMPIWQESSWTGISAAAS
jgi:hypothetical protein